MAVRSAPRWGMPVVAALEMPVAAVLVMPVAAALEMPVAAVLVRVTRLAARSRVR